MAIKDLISIKKICNVFLLKQQLVSKECIECHNDEKISLEKINYENFLI